MPFKKVYKEKYNINWEKNLMYVRIISNNFNIQVILPHFKEKLNTRGEKKTKNLNSKYSKNRNA